MANPEDLVPSANSTMMAPTTNQDPNMAMLLEKMTAMEQRWKESVQTADLGKQIVDGFGSALSKVTEVNTIRGKRERSPSGNPDPPIMEEINITDGYDDNHRVLNWAFRRLYKQPNTKTRGVLE